MTFNAPYTASGEPELDKFTLSFNTLDPDISGVFQNIRIYESASTTYSAGTVTDVTALGAIVNTGSSPAIVTVDFTAVPRSLLSPLTYFVIADIDPSVTASSNAITPTLVDGGFGSPDDTNIVTSAGSATSNVIGQTYSFSIFVCHRRHRSECLRTNCHSCRQSSCWWNRNLDNHNRYGWFVH